MNHAGSEGKANEIKLTHVSPFGVRCSCTETGVWARRHRHSLLRRCDYRGDTPRRGKGSQVHFLSEFVANCAVRFEAT
jgi:hypothetical protein